MSVSDTRNPVYIGDGVYLSDDGWQLWLSVGSHTNPPVVALDEDTFNELIRKGQERFAKIRNAP